MHHLALFSNNWTPWRGLSHEYHGHQQEFDICFSLFGCIKIFLCGTLSVLFLRWTHFLFEHNNVILWAGLRARAEKYLNAWQTLSIRSFFKRSSHDLDGLLSYQCLFLRFIEVIGNTYSNKPSYTFSNP